MNPFIKTVTPAKQTFGRELLEAINDEIRSIRLLVHRVGPWAGLRNCAKNGVPIEVALVAHCGALPKVIR